jgi:hypothetical protein
MAEIVFAFYRPKPGREAELAALVDVHVAELRELGLVTDRAPVVARSRKDGTVVEVFEWASGEAIERAHQDPTVQALWARFAACADYPSFAQLAEASEPFAGFEPLRVQANAAAAPKRRAARKPKPARRAAKKRGARATKKRGK